MLGGTRGVRAGPASARGGRLARAEDSTDQPADELRGADERARGFPPTNAGRLLDDVVEQIAEMTTLIAGLIELARGGRAPRRSPKTSSSICSTADAAVEQTRRDAAREWTFAADLEESVVWGVPPSLERAIGEPARQRGQVEPAGRRGRGRRRKTATVTVRDHGPGIDRSRPARTSSIASTARRQRARSPARASASRSSARWPRPTAATSWRSAPPAAAPGSPCA